MAGRRLERHDQETIEEETESAIAASSAISNNSTKKSGVGTSSEVFGASKRIYSIRNGNGGTIHFAWQNSSGSLLATSLEGSHCVYIYTRQGTTVQQLPLKGNCAGLAWDEDGDFLAIITEASSIIVLWDSHSRKLIEIESNIKDPGSCLAWSKTSKILAYTTNKGNLLVYNHQTLRKVPIIGKHSKRIVAAAWSNDNCLALATIDNQLSINTIDGDAIKSVHLRAKPSDLKFGNVKEDQSTLAVDNTVSLIVGEKTLYLLKVEEANSSNSPLELGFQSRYGNIVSHFWHGDGYILCSFSGGFIVMISSHHREIGSELVLTELRHEPLRASSLSQAVSKFAVCYGENIVDIREASDTNKVLTTVNLYEAENKVRPAVRCQWNIDGQLLAIVTTTGDLHVYVTTVPIIGAAIGSYIVQMSSLSDLTIHSFQQKDNLTNERTISLEIEPNIIAISSTYFTVTVNNRVWYYSFVEVLENLATETPLVKEYNANVTAISLNDEYVAVRTGERLALHLIEDSGTMDVKEVHTFPENWIRKDAKLTTHCLLREFLIYGLDNATMKIFGLEQWKEIATVKIPNGIALRRIYPDATDCNIVLVDRNGNGYLYDMVSDLMHLIPNFPARYDGLLWDTDESMNHVFAVYFGDLLTVQLYIVRKDTISGTFVENLGYYDAFKNAGQKPYILKKGKIYFQTSVGQIDCTDFIYVDNKKQQQQQIDNGQNINNDGSTDANYKMNQLKTMIKFKNFDEAYIFCTKAKQNILWSELAKAAMEAMELKLAVKIFVQLKNVGMAMDLAEVLEEVDFKISCGHVALLLQKYDLAQDCYVGSSEPYSALHMRMALGQWDLAEELAREFADDYVCEVTAKYALQEENLGEHNHALELFERAVDHSKSYGVAYPDEVELCEAGIARNSIRCGQYKRGMEIALESKNPILLKDCAEGLEHAKCYAEAALLYEECEEWDKAAALYIRNKNWSRVGTILPRIKSSRIYMQYARAKESEEQYLEAAEAYEKAKEIESACRMYTKLNRPDDAIRLVKAHKSIGGALVTARYFENLNDYDTAIRFLIISKCHEDALGLAFRYGKAELYVSIVQEIVAEFDNESGGGGGGSNYGYEEDAFGNYVTIMPQEYRDGIKKVGQYYEDQKDHIRAGKYFLIAGQSRKAFIILLKSASSGLTYDEDNLLTLLTDATAACKDAHFEKQYIEFCLGTKDGSPKDPKHLLTYYLNVRKYSEAVTTSLIMSSDYRESGQYKLAHQTLFQICREYKRHRMHIPKDLQDEFIITHSYILARVQSSVQNNAYVAGRLHHRLLLDIDKFPLHTVQIMSQSVVFCQKGGLHRTAMDTCYTLMKPENRPNIPSHYKSKFETMVRKQGKSVLKDNDDETSACPFCGILIPNFDLTCSECRADIPMCIVSGRHLTGADLTVCPSCDFPAIRSEFFKLLKDSKNPVCPLCDEFVDLRDCVLINDPRPYLFPADQY